MKKRLLSILLIIAVALNLCGCNPFWKNNSTFSITFIDVGQGDSALVECDGRFMLIDAGNKSAGDKVKDVLEINKAQHLDILAFSHPHEDHIGGMPTVMASGIQVDCIIGNTDSGKNNSTALKDIENELPAKKRIKIPKIGKKYKLGNAKIEVVDVASEKDNDSLVLLVTYGKIRFLFTGDIQDDALQRITDKYYNDDDKPFKVDLIKMPHHGAYSKGLYEFIRTFMPEIAVISVGEDNKYHHPNEDTLDKLNDADIKIYRTDWDGDIKVKSDGKHISIETEK